MKPNLIEKRDFFLVNEKIWIFLLKMYGGGPELKLTEYYPVIKLKNEKLILKPSGLINNNLFCYANASMQMLLSIG